MYYFRCKNLRIIVGTGDTGTNKVFPVLKSLQYKQIYKVIANQSKRL